MSANADRALIFCLCLVSILMPVTEYWIRTRNAGNPVSREVSIRWLALPVSLHRQGEPSGLWGSLLKLDREMVPDLETEVPDPIPEEIIDPAHRFQLYGVVREGNAHVYCFLDTKEMRWFRLQTGERDAVSGTELMMSETENYLYLWDPAGGPQFRIEPDDWALFPVNPEDTEPGAPLP